MEKINNTKMVAEKVNAVFEEACLPIRVKATEVWIDLGANYKDITLVVSNDGGEHFTHQTEPRNMDYAHSGNVKEAALWLCDKFERYERKFTIEEWNNFFTAMRNNFSKKVA